MTTTKANIDFETRSPVDLKTNSTRNYASDPRTEVLCLQYCIGDGPVKLVTDFTKMPDDLREHVENGGVVSAFNYLFEYCIWKYIMEQRFGWVPLDHKQMSCTMAKCLNMGLPGSLAKAAEALGLEQDKDGEGHKLMLKMCKPRPRRKSDGEAKGPFWHDSYEMRERLYAYCEQDVVVERAIDRALPDLGEFERKIFDLDREINNRGIQCDTDLCNNISLVFEQSKQEANKRVKEITGGKIDKLTQNAALVKWLNDVGVRCDSVNKESISNMLDNPRLKPEIAEILRLKRDTGKTSIQKAAKMARYTDARGRLRDSIQYYGASTTGRFAGRDWQPHNMPREELKDFEIPTAIELVKKGDVTGLVETFGTASKALPSCIRGALVAKKGNKLGVADFSSIEARALAWLAGQHNILEAFRTHGKIYELEATNIFPGTKLESVTKDQRAVGKVATLALGYAGWVGALQNMASVYGMDLDDEFAKKICMAYRKGNDKIVQFWADLEHSATRAIQNPGKPFGTRNIKYMFWNGFLYCKLPSGREMVYAGARLVQVTNRYGDEVLEIRYKGIDSVTKRYVEQSTYGGKLAENVTQAVARDLLCEAMLRLEKAFHVSTARTVLHVHDEVIVEFKDNNSLTIDDICAILKISPEWALDLPLDADGFEDYRYHK